MREDNVSNSNLKKILPDKILNLFLFLLNAALLAFGDADCLLQLAERYVFFLSRIFQLVAQTAQLK